MPPGNPLTWMQVLQILVSFTAGTFSGFFVDYFRRRWSRTSIQVLFEGDSGVITTPDNRNKPKIIAKYVRIRVNNIGRLQYALKLKCFLTTIERDINGDGTFWQPIFSVPLQCAWSYHGHTGHMDIPPLLWTYFDLVKTTNQMDFLETQTTWHPLLLERELTEPGIYRFNFQVSGENIQDPYEGSVTIKWTGVWNEIQVMTFVAKRMMRKRNWLPWLSGVRR